MAEFGGINEIATGFNPSNLMAILDSPVFSKVWFFVKIFIYFLIVVFGGILYYKFWMQYKINVTIKSRVGGGGLEIKKDKAKIVVDKQNKRKLQLYKSRNGKQALTCPVPPAIYKMKNGKKDSFELWLDDNFQLHPILPPQINNDDPALKIMPQERAAWARYEDKALREKYQKKDLLEKYLPAGIMIMAMITAFLIWFFAVKELGSGLSGLAQQFAQIASSCTSLGVG